MSEAAKSTKGETMIIDDAPTSCSRFETRAGSTFHLFFKIRT